MNKNKQQEEFLEAYNFCVENQCSITFITTYTHANYPSHVVVNYGLMPRVIGLDIIEATNRLKEMMHTAPCNYEKLSWWKESTEFYRCK